MKVRRQLVVTVTLALAVGAHTAAGQTALTDKNLPSSGPPTQTLTETAATSRQNAPDSTAVLFDLQNDEIKFKLNSFMKVLRDSRHEGWVLAAYPDPKTSRPLIGAGFSLDVDATEHIQQDPLNSRLFLEPSSAQLWQAAGLDPEQLQKILGQFDRNLQAWKKKRYRRKIKTHALPPQITEEQATNLLRISAMQAVHNARAYCRDFDRLTAAQQMALSQLVFQMGVNLEEFVQFLGALNGDVQMTEAALTNGTSDTDRDHWRAVQQTLIESQWARRYSTRAVAVIAMFDPEYSLDPLAAERRVQVVLRPPAKHHHKKPHATAARAKNEGVRLAHRTAATSE